MRIVAISDTHGLHSELELPVGDLLIHAGDVSTTGDTHQIYVFKEWIKSLDFEHKIWIPGNHDKNSGTEPYSVGNTHFLYNSGVEIEGIKFWGMPQTPTFFDWYHMADPGYVMQHYTRQIPVDTDVLITHGPPYGVLDECYDFTVRCNAHAGCLDLAARYDVYDEGGRAQLINPMYHFFGHIHEGYGVDKMEGTDRRTTFHNVSCCDRGYNLVNPPTVIDI